MGQGENSFIGLISFLFTLLIIFILPVYFAYHSSIWEAFKNVTEEAQACLVIFGGIATAVLAKKVEKKVKGCLVALLGGEEKESVVVVAVPPPDVVVGVAVPSQDLRKERRAETERFDFKSFIVLFLWTSNTFLFFVAVIIRTFGGNGLQSLYEFIMERYSLKGVIILSIIFSGYIAWESAKEVQKDGPSISERFFGRDNEYPETFLGIMAGFGNFIAGLFGVGLVGLLVFSIVLDDGIKGMGDAFGKITIWEQANWIFVFLYSLFIIYLLGMEKGRAWEEKRGL